MLSPYLSLGLDLQCFTWLGNIVPRFIDIHFQRSTVRLTISRLSCRSYESFSFVLFPTCLKIFRILLSMNLIHLVTVSYHQVFQERQFQTEVSLLFLTFYARATIDSDPPRGS